MQHVNYIWKSSGLVMCVCLIMCVCPTVRSSHVWLLWLSSVRGCQSHITQALFLIPPWGTVHCYTYTTPKTNLCLANVHTHTHTISPLLIMSASALLDSVGGWCEVVGAGCGLVTLESTTSGDTRGGQGGWDTELQGGKVTSWSLCWWRSLLWSSPLIF